MATLAIIIYFAWSARPAIDFFSSVSFRLERHGGSTEFFGYLWSLMGDLMVVVTLLAIGLEIFDIEGESATIFLLLVAWATLGWYVGRDFNPSNFPIFSYMAFTAITYLLAILLAVRTLSVIFNGAKPCLLYTSPSPRD